MSDIFKFKQFSINQQNAPFKIGTDGVLLGCWAAKNTNKVNTILDIGTGTGVIALIMAQRFLNAKVSAVEINKTAANLAKNNFNQSLWANRIQLIESSLQDFRPSTRYDIIVSNPPYFVNSAISGDRSKDTARHTLKLDFKAVLHFASNQLSPVGTLYLVLPFSSKEEIIKKASELGLFPNRICEVLPTPHASPKRILISITNEKSITSFSSLIVEQNVRHQYSNDYKELTKEYYINF